MTGTDRIVAVGLLTERDLAVLGQGFQRIYRLDDSREFDNLLTAIDRADERIRMPQKTPSAS
ncbi:hypothetical protein ACBY01_16880 [Sphingomonas sp. ac-8]|uniref:hypothetical protein n=1 Tax=Sphingomonas sp. ac-8 TaxID=3242977 RepID=UPI003A81311C